MERRTPLGMFSVCIEVAHPEQCRFELVSALVDTGATYAVHTGRVQCSAQAFMRGRRFSSRSVLA